MVSGLLGPIVPPEARNLAEARRNPGFRGNLLIDYNHLLRYPDMPDHSTLMISDPDQGGSNHVTSNGYTSLRGWSGFR